MSFTVAFRGQQEDEDTPQFPRGRRSPPNLRERGEDKLQPNGVGSGVIISTDGYILTNNHVVGEADKLEAVIDVKGVSKRFEAKIIGADPQTDVALIKIEAFDLIPAILSDSTKLRVGDIVLAAGAPMELSRSVTQGIVSALGRSGMGIIGNRRTNGYEDFIQTDAAINPGNSGGPLVDALGRVVGINTAIYSKSGMSAGIGFAIPINLALRVAEDLIDDGAVTRGFLGVRPKDIDAETMKIWGLSDETGALVEIVTNNSPAAKAGVQVGDVIVGVQGQKVENASKLPLIVSSYKPGTVISIDVIRDGKPTTLQAKLIKLSLDEEGNIIGTNAEEDDVPVSRAAPAAAAASVAEIVDGVTIQNLTPSTRERYEVPDEIQGVIVTLVNDESRAAATGIEEGDVILEIGRDKKKVRAVGEAVQMANSASNKVLLKVWRKGDMMMIMIDKK
ncbi:MAG: trypsin-like peptidase domain-containing protein [Verrucomicrobia bacterium]|nr:trypsin-like peptidase domain-containing protein [Verrucomicrobiota bacterium]